MNIDERTYIEERMSSFVTLINARFTNVDEKLEDIHKEQLRTNGTVKKHTEQIDEALIERARNRQEQKQHVEVLCECKEKLGKIEKDFSDVSFYLRHPKLFVAGLIVIIALSLGSFLTNNPLKVFDKSPQTEQTK